MPDVPWKPPAPPEDPLKLGEECFQAIAEALAVDLTPAEEAALRRLFLYSDRSDCWILAALITRAAAAAANRAIKGTLWDRGDGGQVEGPA
jgi:hypothetical protein